MSARYLSPALLALTIMTSDTSRDLQVQYGCAVASIEGWAQMDFAGDDIANHTQAGLDTRVRQLEGKYQFNSPPPCTEPTWESLAWRITQLRMHQSRMPPFSRMLDLGFGDLLPKDVEVSDELLKKTLLELGKGFFPRILLDLKTPLPKDICDEELLDILRQKIMWIGGRESVTFPRLPITRREVYIYLASLTIKFSTDMRRPGMGMGIPPPMMRPRPEIVHVGPKKACSRCCACVSREGSSDSGSEVSSISVKPKRKFGFGWLRKLVCWRTKDDSASIMTKSSRGSSTTLDV